MAMLNSQRVNPHDSDKSRLNPNPEPRYRPSTPLRYFSPAHCAHGAGQRTRAAPEGWSALCEAFNVDQNRERSSWESMGFHYSKWAVNGLIGFFFGFTTKHIRSCVGWCLKLTWVQLLRHNICFYRDLWGSHNSKLMEGEIWTYVKWSWSNKVTITSKKMEPTNIEINTECTSIRKHGLIWHPSGCQHGLGQIQQKNASKWSANVSEPSSKQSKMRTDIFY